MTDAPVILLWTGGWDSTFRLLQLLLELRLPVQPLYLLDDTRASASMEIATMDRIRDLLGERYPQTRTLLRRTIFDRVADIEPDDDVQRAYERLAVKFGIGSQYEWLARYAVQHGTPGIEMACECIPFGASKVLMYRTVPTTSVHGYRTFSVDPGEPDPDVRLLFDGYAYPLITTAREAMIDIAEAHGWVDLMGMTWFCHRPTSRGEPCGLCHPCLSNIGEGFGWRIPARRRALSAVYRHTLWPVREIARKGRLRLRAWFAKSRIEHNPASGTDSHPPVR
jgi:hypothetical protein